MASAYGGLDEDDNINTGIVDIASANRRVWLVKVPDYLADRLEQLDEDGVDLGVVRATPVSAGAPASVKLLLSPGGPCGDLPLEYTMQLSKCDQTMHLFCEDLAGQALLVEGKVEQECHLKPVLNEQYRDVMRRRNEVANKPKRTIQVVDAQGATVPGFVKHVSEHQVRAKERRRYEPELRRERLPKVEVMDILFRAFERIPHWTLKGLVDHTQQPTTYLRDILSEIAIHNNRGPYKNLYELKPEYKRL